MDPWLEELQAQGKLDSRGAFEVDHERALQQLRRYQLSDPRRAILHIVRAAVLCGAEWMRIRTNAHETEAEFPGVVAASEFVPGLLTWLVAPDRLSQRFQLALAVNAALAYADVDVTSWDGQQCARLRLTEDWTGRSELGLEPPWREPRTRVRMRKRAKVSFFQRKQGGESDLVAQNCAWAPLRLTLNHNQLTPPPFGDARAAELRIYSRAAVPTLPLPPRTVRCQHWTVETLMTGDPVEGQEGLLVAALHLHGPPGTLIQEGVRLSELPLCALVSASGLRLDLTGETLLQSERSALLQRLEGFSALLI